MPTRIALAAAVCLAGLAAPASAGEDCLPVDAASLSIKHDGDYWKVIDKKSSHLAAKDEKTAKRMLAVVRHYKVDSFCYVGRPHPPFAYVLVSGKAPSGAMEKEDCVPFDPAKLAVQRYDATLGLFGGKARIAEGGHYLFDFDKKTDEARQALELIKKYGFTQSCFVGRPNPPFSYLRR